VIASLLIWLYQGVLFYLYGASTLTLLSRWLRRSPSEGVGLSLTIVLGMAQVTALATLLALALPLGALASAILLSGGVLLAVLARPLTPPPFHRPRGSEWWLALIMLVAVVFCLEAATEAPTNPDTNAYHAQTIHWIEAYPAVPGLGNLNGRLAYNSSWLLLNAAFSFSFLGLRSFHVLPGLMFLVSMWQFLGGLRGLMRREFTIPNWMRVLFIPAAFWILRGELSAPGTDLPAILLTWILLSDTIEYEASADENPVRGAVLATIPAFLIVLKLSAAPLILVSGYMLVRALLRRDARLAAALIALAALMLAPWIARSVILSGYPVYPYPQLDLFHVDWKVPPTDVDGVRNGILGWARLPMKAWGEALSMPARAWIPEWLEQRTANQLLILLLAALSPVGLLPRANRKSALPVLAAYAALLVWFFGAPNWRFGYGVVLGLTAFTSAAGLSGLSLRLPDRLSWLTSRSVPALLAAFLVLTTVALFDEATVGERLVLPMDYNPSRATECEVDSLPLYCAAANGTCSYASFPCVPGVPQTIRARGTGLGEGFLSVDLEAAAP
jgi:hypothetical protein